MRTEPHDEFLELSALSTSGQLNEEEQKRLREHLAVCPACREALREYETLIDDLLPGIAARKELGHSIPIPGWSEKKAERALFERLAEEEQHTSRKAQSRSTNSPKTPRSASTREGPTWRQVWLLYAAGILFFMTGGLYVYRLHRASENQQFSAATSANPTSSGSLEEQLSDLGHERAVAEAEIRQRDQMIAELRRQLATESASIEAMKSAQEGLRREKGTSQTGSERLSQEQTDLEAKLQTSESDSQALQEKMNSLVQQSARQTAYGKSLEAKNADLTRLLEQRETELEQQDQLLAHDKDIRDLMGARDLYVAEVYDIARGGETKKPYGRVFYTRGKSLIFYAYDLDQDGDAGKAPTFQAWGRRGVDRQQALNLGIFYEDNLARKRWILKCEDPKTLARIDGVFVTIEPNGGSEKPSGKPLLSAYLKINPNHP